MSNEPNNNFDDDWPEDHRSGVIAVIGRPNVGKSTLINGILKQKIAIVTNKPQTTRSKQLGIYTEEKGQILFTDTPGIHKPHHKLGEYMVIMAQQALQDADLILWLLDASAPPQKADQLIAQTIKTMRGNTPVVMALNKIDQAAKSSNFDEHKELIEHISAVEISALQGTNVSELVKYLLEQLPLGPRYYPADQVSEANMRFIASEVIREKIIINTEQEIPHSVAVEIVDFKERENNMTYIDAIIYVERNSQKGIIIGKGGTMIKRIGTEARKELAQMLDTRVFTEIHVKVLKNWRSNEPLMRRLGYRLPKKDK